MQRREESEYSGGAGVGVALTHTYLPMAVVQTRWFADLKAPHSTQPWFKHFRQTTWISDRDNRKGNHNFVTTEFDYPQKENFYAHRRSCWRVMCSVVCVCLHVLSGEGRSLPMMYWSSPYIGPPDPGSPCRHGTPHQLWPCFPLLVTSSGYHWRSVQTCSLDLIVQPPTLPSVLTSSGHRSKYSWQAGSIHPTGMLSCYLCNYFQPTKLWEGNVFSHVCQAAVLSTWLGSPIWPLLDMGPYCTGTPSKDFADMGTHCAGAPH